MKHFNLTILNILNIKSIKFSLQISTKIQILNIEFNLSMEGQQQQKPHIIIILPSRKVPEIIKPFIEDLNDVEVRFITGHRNVIQKNTNNQYEWAVVQNQNYCGQVCCYLVKQTLEKQQIQNIPKIVVQNSCSIFQKYSQQTFIFRCLTRTQIKQKIPNQTITELINQVLQCPQTQGVAINLIKNSFDNYQDYKNFASEGVQKRQQQWLSKTEDPVPTVTQLITMEQNTRKIVGNMVRKVPKCSNETGNWNSEDLIQIKFTE